MPVPVMNADSAKKDFFPLKIRSHTAAPLLCHTFHKPLQLSTLQPQQPGIKTASVTIQQAWYTASVQFIFGTTYVQPESVSAQTNPMLSRRGKSAGRNPRADGGLEPAITAHTGLQTARLQSSPPLLASPAPSPCIVCCFSPFLSFFFFLVNIRSREHLLTSRRQTVSPQTAHTVRTTFRYWH